MFSLIPFLEKLYKGSVIYIPCIRIECRRRIVARALIRLFSIFIVICIIGVAYAGIVSVAGPTVMDKLSSDAVNHEIAVVREKQDSSLNFLMTAKKRGMHVPSILDLVSKDNVKVSVRFTSEITYAKIKVIEELGARFSRMDGKVMHIGPVYIMTIPWVIIDDLSAMPEVERIEALWHPRLQKTLDVSVPEIRADDVWTMKDSFDRNITGKDVLIANLDTGIDVFHPSFWRQDGGIYDWIDVDDSNSFENGIDAVDLNRNGLADLNETLCFFDGAIYDWYGGITNDDGVFQTSVDWLYNDENNDGMRNYGTAQGFTENDPTYGELLFIANDTNDNLMLDIEEKLLALNTSKIYKTNCSGNVEYTRGINLISSGGDNHGHGTSVSGILSGGIIGHERFTGIAPDADLMIAEANTNEEFEEKYVWAANNDADIILIEWGEWTWLFLDGSSNLEHMMDTKAGEGVIQVVPAGNLAGGIKHFLTNVSNQQTSTTRFVVPFYAPQITEVWLSVLWRDTSNPLTLEITTPTGGGGNTVVLPGDGSIVTTADGHEIYSYKSNSSRGTAKMDVSITRGGSSIAIGYWKMQITNDLNEVEINGYIQDDQSGWSNGAIFADHITDNKTITWPATADSAITVASYSTRNEYGQVVGALSDFSGRGPRIDDVNILDIAAPGDYDVITAASKDSGYPHGAYQWFGGTSAAGPHVAGAVALMLQADPDLSNEEVKQVLRDTARKDEFTGNVPNIDWGYGKLNVSSAVERVNKQEFGIPVTSGWNLISVPLKQSNTSILNVLDDNGGNTVWNITRGYEPIDANDHWLTYATFKPQGYNDLTDVNRTMGLWINITNVGDGYLNVTGMRAGSTTILLYRGWNLIGYPSLTEKNVSDALKGIPYDKVEGYDANSSPYYLKTLTDEDMMRPGCGYWIHVTTDCKWIIDG
jgi:subtilisin family serine protease